MKIAKEFILREIAGESILIPTGTTTQEFNGMITMSETAKFIWENLESTGSLAELIQKVLDAFEVDEETAAADTTAFVTELERAGFVEFSDPEAKW